LGFKTGTFARHHKDIEVSFSLADFQNGEAVTYLSAENKIL